MIDSRRIARDALCNTVDMDIRQRRLAAVLVGDVPAVYPSRCESAAADTETVTVRYNVSRFGKVVGPEAIATTNPCFNRAAIASVSRWDFEPATENGNAVSDVGRTSRVVFRRP